jgi:hypothetical protein
VTSHCTVQLRAYETPDRTGRAAWDEGASRQACTTLSRAVTLEPGDTARFVATSSPRLPEGRYYFVATLRRTDRRVELTAGHLDL